MRAGTAPPQDFLDYVESACSEILQKCTVCEKCFEVCPMAEMTPLQGTDAKAAILGALGMLRGETDHRDGRVFVDACTKCGQCVDVCPQGLNPRKMLTLARYKAATTTPSEDSRGSMRRLSQIVNVMGGLQLTAEERRLLTRDSGITGKVEVVFHASCRVLATPHIIFNVMDILDTMGVSYVVLGGIPHCCGVQELARGGSDPAAVTRSTLRKFAAFRPTKVLTWCPTCLLTFNESTRGLEELPYTVEQFVDFLAERLDLWIPKAKPVSKRVALHVHAPGMPVTMGNARRVVENIPGVTVVNPEGAWTFFDWCYQCSPTEYRKLPEAARRARRQLLDAAQIAGAEVIVTVYHGCHRFLCDAERDCPVQVKNITDLVRESLGLDEREDTFKRFKLYQDWRAILEDSKDYIAMNKLDVTTVEEILPAMLAGKL